MFYYRVFLLLKFVKIKIFSEHLKKDGIIV